MKLGVIFDWDGIIIDSSALHERSWDMLAEEEKRTLPEDHFVKGFGRKNEYIIPNILAWADDEAEIARLSYRKEELYRELVKEDGLEPLPGVRELLEELKKNNIPTCVGSSTPRINLDAVVDEIGLSGLFDDFVAADDVGAGKPDPEVFIKAAERIKCARAECVVFEDALHGIEAGLAGGMKVIGVATTHPIEELKAAHWQVKSMADVTLRHLKDLIAQ